MCVGSFSHEFGGGSSLNTGWKGVDCLPLIQNLWVCCHANRTSTKLLRVWHHASGNEMCKFYRQIEVQRQPVRFGRPTEALKRAIVWFIPNSIRLLLKNCQLAEMRRLPRVAKQSYNSSISGWRLWVAGCGCCSCPGTRASCSNPTGSNFQASLCSAICLGALLANYCQ